MGPLLGGDGGDIGQHGLLLLTSADLELQTVLFSPREMRSLRVSPGIMRASARSRR